MQLDGHTVIELLTHTAGDEIAMLACWLQRKLQPHEKFVAGWHNQQAGVLQIAVKDANITPDLPRVSDNVLTLTVDVSGDRIRWSNEAEPGRCVVRNKRWWRMFKDAYPDIIIAEKDKNPQVVDERPKLSNRSSRRTAI